jgi:endonuclease/exonuclease/phosphatase family metal-dependent hydrolase
MTQDELQELDEKYSEQLEARSAAEEELEIELGFVRPPKAWITRFGWLCTTAVVRADHEDPTHVLDPLELAFVDADGTRTTIPQHQPGWWGITPEVRSVPPAAKTYVCVPPLELCPLLPDAGPLPTLRFFVEAGLGENEAFVPLDGDFGDDVRRTCEATRREGYVEAPDPVGEDPVGLRVLTFNVWHGLRSGESRSKFPGEDEERKASRFAWQIRLIQELDPDILFFQEVNPNQREARTYAQTLNYEEIHKVTSCGFHLPPIKVPKNVNDGLAILARPGLGLRRVQTKRLSGNASCTATFGFQTKESRYVLMGEITVLGKKILLATTHLSSPPYVPPDFNENLKGLLADEVLSEEQYGEIVDTIERKRARNLDETRKLLGQIQKYREKLNDDGRPLPVILGGDFNTEPGTASIEAVEDFGLQNVGTGPDYLTWDPVKNHENYAIGSRRGWPVPTFDLEEVETLLEPRRTTARQIDFLFVSEQGQVVSSKMAMDQERNGMFPSDHFAIFAVIDIELDPPELDLNGGATAD